jgi:putative flavoprotein involved in K+ transport
MEWLIDMKFFEIKAEEIHDPVMLKMKPPQITGTGGSKYTISLQSLAKKGVTIMGKTDKADETNVHFQPNAAMHVKFADQFSNMVKEMIDGFIIKTGLNAEPAQIDDADLPDINASCASSIMSLNFEQHNIGSVIWCTGFDGDFSYVKLPVFDDEGNFRHKDGIPAIPGLYFLGYPWLRSRKSVLLFGIKDDAQFVVDKIYDDLRVHEQPISVAV